MLVKRVLSVPGVSLTVGLVLNDMGRRLLQQQMTSGSQLSCEDAQDQDEWRKGVAKVHAMPNLPGGGNAR